MKVLVIYDSNFGNTKFIADLIAHILDEDTKVLSVSEYTEKSFEQIDLLILGSPIVGWKPTEKMQEFLNSIKADQLKGLKAVTFDTRIKLFIHGDATKKMSEKLAILGAEIISEPQKFYVKSKEGPLYKEELKKAKEWATFLKNKIIQKQIS